jgi:hypothetical protein
MYREKMNYFGVAVEALYFPHQIACLAGQNQAACSPLDLWSCHFSKDKYETPV